jgi:NADH-quinone oxidoreductase E subunit
MSFSFTPENLTKAKAHLAKYPADKAQSAVLPLLDLAQRQNGGWLSQACLEYVGAFLSMPAIRVHEVASFYTLFNLRPVGTYHVQLCGTTPCMLCGCEDIKQTMEQTLGITCGETTPDGLFTLTEVECLGACVNAPVAQINDTYVEHLTPQRVHEILTNLKAGKPLENASPIKEPAGGTANA